MRRSWFCRYSARTRADASHSEKFGVAPQFLHDKRLSPRWLPGQLRDAPQPLSPPSRVSLAGPTSTFPVGVPGSSMVLQWFFNVQNCSRRLGQCQPTLKAACFAPQESTVCQMSKPTEDPQSTRGLSLENASTVPCHWLSDSCPGARIGCRSWVFCDT